MNQPRKNSLTPWGRADWIHKIDDGIVMIGTPSHGGIWLSQERIKELPEHYEPFTRSRQWAEEDEDGGLVLQYLGLLTLIQEEITLEITDIDIIIGKASRRIYYGSPYFDGPIAEAYKRQTGDHHEEMICANGILSPRPGGFKLAKLCEKAKDLMDNLDKGLEIQPTTVTLTPYKVYEPQKFIHFLDNGTTHTERVSGGQAHKVLKGNKKAIEDYINYRKYFPNFDKTLKITHEGKVIYKKE